MRGLSGEHWWQLLDLQRRSVSFSKSHVIGLQKGLRNLVSIQESLPLSLRTADCYEQEVEQECLDTSDMLNILIRGRP